MTAEIFDSHAHYDSSAFDGDRDEVLIGLKSKGVCGVINCATDLETARISLLPKNIPSFMLLSACSRRR